jgi:hypothetical protein
MNSEVTVAEVNVNAIGEYVKLESLINDALCAGWIEDGAISDNGDGTVAVTGGEALLRATASETGKLYYCVFSAVASLSVPSGATRYIYVNYNSGAPVVQASASAQPNNFQYCYLGEVHNLGGTTLLIHADPRPAGDIGNRITTWAENLIGDRVASGEIVTDASAPSRKIAVTAGVVYDRFYKQYTTPAVDTNGAGTFTALYQDGAGGWTIVSAQTQWNNTQYDNGSGTLATMTTAYYANRWVIRSFSGEVYVMYGNAEYATSAAAEAAAMPTRPVFLDKHGFYIAQIVFQKSASSATSITALKPTIGTIGGTTGGGGGTSTHNDLGGLQGGAAGEYYHLSSSQLTNAAFLNVVNAWSKAQSGAISALTVSANAIAVDLSLANNFSVTLQATTSQVLSAPSNAVAGQSGLIYITQNATPSALTYNTFWKFPGGTVPAVSTGAGAQDVFVYTVAPGATYADCQLQKGFA